MCDEASGSAGLLALRKTPVSMRYYLAPATKQNQPKQTKHNKTTQNKPDKTFKIKQNKTNKTTQNKQDTTTQQTHTPKVRQEQRVVRSSPGRPRSC